MSHIACNQYAWQTFYRRKGRNWHDAVAHGVAEIAQAGFDGFEPILSSTEQLDALIPLLQRNGLAMRSIYVNSVLHVGDAVGQSIEQALALADTAAAASQLGTQIIVTNPSPIAWNGTESKTDEQLEIQADALGRLGRALHERGLTLAYHVHDAELRHAARELHHIHAGRNLPRTRYLLLGPRLDLARRGLFPGGALRRCRAVRASRF